MIGLSHTGRVKVRRAGTRDQHQFPRVATIPFFETVTVKGPESMALNELGESFLFLITKPVL